MKCKQVKNLIGPYLYGDLAPDEMKAIRLHVQECAECRNDIMSQGQVLSHLHTAMPELSDVDRQKIAYGVRGAIEDKQQTRVGYGISPAWGFLLTIVLLLGIGIGAAIGPRLGRTSLSTNASVKHKAKGGGAEVVVTVEPTKKIEHSKKIRKEELASSTRTNTATNTRKRYRRKRYSPLQNMPLATVTNGITSRSPEKKHDVKVTEPPTPVVTDTENKDAKELNNDVKLPESTDPNNAETVVPNTKE